ncbi:MAG: 23S rRNA (pseudouridine(1915)-N(3))-methyltransferase RlmH [Gemmatimonadaceae bacterium]|nr:23S rRNA (pseudouridine(1915)-N(3))-methyltransferase RlmH [Gemmatimonadaceae bacterium]
MKFRVVAVGRPRDRALAESIADYEGRAARYWPLEVAEVKEERGGEGVVAMRREGERLLERAAGSVIVACDERGDAMTSTDFAAWMQRLREGGRDVSFVMGGAFGLDDAVRQAASRLITLAPFTLPHEVARLVLAEQLYRAGTIVRREPYHKA